MSLWEMAVYAQLAAKHAYTVMIIGPEQLGQGALDVACFCDVAGKVPAEPGEGDTGINVGAHGRQLSEATGWCPGAILDP